MTEVVEVACAGKRIYLVGTAHVSQESVKVVEQTIAKVKPDVVAVELDETRERALRDERRWEETEITKVIKSGQGYLFLTQLMLSNFQRRIGEEIGVKPGAEMLAALHAAEEQGIPVALVDRDVKVTLKRAMAAMSATEKLKLAYGFIEGIFAGEEINEELIETLKEKDILTEMLEELSREIPSIKRILVDERDHYIAGRISMLDGEKIVAVVGAGHVDGIKKRLERINKSRTHSVRITSLEKEPVKRSRLKYMAYGIPILVLLLFAWGFISYGADMTARMLLLWFLANGTLSALGAALALGHPASILTAFLAAPFTSLNPTIAAGWFAGLVELKVRGPRVRDFKSLLKLNTVGDYWRNRVTRVLLVIAFANLGSSLGTFIALPYIASLL